MSPPPAAAAPARRAPVVHEAIWAPLVVLALGAARFLPLDRLPGLTCPFHVLTGVPCPTCGGTRALTALAHLDVAGALAMNPLVALAGIGGMVYAAHAAGVALGRRRPWRPAVRSRRAENLLRLAAAALLAGNWIYLIAAGR